jgi:GTPase SAR1 family protein
MPEYPFDDISIYFGSELRYKATVFISGSRGVGKTSLKSRLDDLLRNLLIRINSETGRTVFENIVRITEEDPPPSDPSLSKEHRWLFIDVYDICSEKSFDEVIQRRRARARQRSRGACPQVTDILLGNKIDMEFWRAVSLQRGRAEAVGGKFVEVSALSGQHVDFVVDAILEVIVENFAELLVRANSASLSWTKLDWTHKHEATLARLDRIVEETNQIASDVCKELSQQASLLNSLNEEVESTKSKRTIAGFFGSKKNTKESTTAATTAAAAAASGRKASQAHVEMELTGSRPPTLMGAIPSSPPQPLLSSLSSLSSSSYLAQAQAPMRTGGDAVSVAAAASPPSSPLMASSISLSSSLAVPPLQSSSLDSPAAPAPPVFVAPQAMATSAVSEQFIMDEEADLDYSESEEVHLESSSEHQEEDAYLGSVADIVSPMQPEIRLHPQTALESRKEEVNANEDEDAVDAAKNAKNELAMAATSRRKKRKEENRSRAERRTEVGGRKREEDEVDERAQRRDDIEQVRSSDKDKEAEQTEVLEMEDEYGGQTLLIKNDVPLSTGRIESIDEHGAFKPAEELQMQSGSFEENAKRLRKRLFWNRYRKCLTYCCYTCWCNCFSAIYNAAFAVFKKSPLFDNVLADTENGNCYAFVFLNFRLII